MQIIPRKSPFDFDHIFHGWWGGVPGTDTTTPVTFAPKVDIFEEKGKYRIVADLPGVERENIKLTLDEGVLTLEAVLERESKKEEKGKVIRRERFSGSYLRRFDLGDNIAEDDVQAEFNNGVLTLEIPFLEPRERAAKRIQIR
ncbi:Hsp20/alpha crystallin family protein [Microbulbifer thermotolerans]|uniref:Hsp20/alpha crystallin family protein n=1 Tax=Microbulbifer thermotolerans TaxID=252514 RepID=UPI0022490BEE|nr:Hsp20/alpha crystallin family protein [Microbulbifer thermotolerans]MCX2831610.1 Hsp20/alpha crystallin family protein [Microbulbifer thermotolerans]